MGDLLSSVAILLLLPFILLIFLGNWIYTRFFEEKIEGIPKREFEEIKRDKERIEKYENRKHMYLYTGLHRNDCHGQR
jgi:hypothetical protein